MPAAIPAAIETIGALVVDIFEHISGRSAPLTSLRLRELPEETVFPSDKLIAAGFRHRLTFRAGLAELVS